MPDAVLKTIYEERDNNHEWWHVAEQKRSKRLDYLRKAVWKKGALGANYAPGIKIDLEIPTLYTRMWEFWKNDPRMLRKAKALAYVLDNIPIFITDHAQIMGYLGSAPHTIAWCIDGDSMVNEELYDYCELGIIPDPEAESYQKIVDLNKYWAGQTAIDKFSVLLDPEDAVKFSSGALGVCTPTSAYGYSGKNYEYFMTGERAFSEIIAEINASVTEAQERIIGIPGPDVLSLYKRLQNWQAMKTILQACIRYAKRYARLARTVAKNFETDSQRKEELLCIAQTCEQVPAHPPRTLQESLQYDHFIQILTRFEAHEGAWPARPDYYHGPYYDKDVNIEKKITREQALDLLGEFLIRAYEVGSLSSHQDREGIQGIAGHWVWTLGGVKKDGSDACNDMTVALLQAARLVRVNNPTFAFRWHPRVKDEVLRECFECIRQGLGHPSLRNDPILIANSMHWYGHPLEDARTWVHQSSMSPCPTTKHGFQPMRMAAASVNTATIVEYALHNGYDPVFDRQMGPKTGDARTFEDFEQLFAAWVKQMEWLFTIFVRTVNLEHFMDSDLFGRPFLSAISERSVESGLDAVSPIGERGNAWITALNWVENIDSLAAVKRLVFDEKKYTMCQLIDALKRNWEGFENMRLDFVCSAPKWGNDDDYVDAIMIRCLEEAARFSRIMKCPCGNNWPILPENVSGNIRYANIVGALPNGRRLGDALYDGGISPGPGLDKKGPTAVLNSCAKIDHIGMGRAFLLNQRLSPGDLAGEHGYQLWKAYIRTWADLGLDHVQFNMVSDQTLRAAQKDPEKYAELIVRVAGYSAQFIDISRKTQDSIIQRTVQCLG